MNESRTYFTNNIPVEGSDYSLWHPFPSLSSVLRMHESNYVRRIVLSIDVDDNFLQLELLIALDISALGHSETNVPFCYHISVLST